MHFPVFWEERYAIQKVKNGHAWLCATKLEGTHTQPVGRGRVGMICGSTNVGRRLYSNIGYAIMKEM